MNYRKGNGLSDSQTKTKKETSEKAGGKFRDPKIPSERSTQLMVIFHIFKTKNTIPHPLCLQ